MFEAIFQDLKYAARGLGKSPGFSATVILTLALGIGATTAIFSVVYGVLLRPLPYPKPDRLVAIWEVNHRGTYSRLADPNFDDFRDQNHTFQAMAKYSGGVTNVVGAAGPTRTGVAVVTRDFFKVLDVQPAMGRGIAPDDANPGAAPVLLASSRYWKEHLASARDLSTLKLRIQDRIYSVVGILPERFEFPEKTDLWLPAELDPRKPQPHVSQLSRPRTVAQRRERCPGQQRSRRHRRAHRAAIARAERLLAAKRGGSFLAGFADRPGPFPALHPAGCGGFSAARRLRQRG